MASKQWYSRPENIEKQKKSRKIWYELNKESERESAKHRAKLRRDDINKKYIDYKSKLKCEVCGFAHPAVLDFHHTDPTKKEFSPSQKNRITSWCRFLKEVEKCIVLCANCHRIHHYNERNKIE